MDTTTILGKYLISSALESPHQGWGVHFEGNRILEIGPNDYLQRKYTNGHLLDAKDKVILPGFVNPHMHMFSTLSQGMPRKRVFGEVIEWLMEYWWPNIEDKADHESIRASTALSAAMMIKNGITTVCDVMETPFALPGCLDVAGEIIDQSGMRAVLTFEATERINPQNGLLGLEENERFITQNATGKSRLSGMMCVHTTFTCSIPFFNRARSLTDRLGTGIRMHTSESSYETLNSLRVYGKLPFEVYEDIGFLGPDVLASLAIHIHPREIAIAAKRGIKIAHIPRAGANPGCGVAPLSSFLANNMIVGLSTYPHFNAFETMRATQWIQRSHTRDGNLLPSPIILDLMTRSAAKAIGLDCVGELKEGNLADIILVDADFYNTVTETNLIDLLVSQKDSFNIDTVIIDGKIVLQNGRLLTLDYDKVIDDARMVSKKLWMKNEISLSAVLPEGT